MNVVIKETSINDHAFSVKILTLVTWSKFKKIGESSCLFGTLKENPPDTGGSNEEF